MTLRLTKKHGRWGFCPECQQFRELHNGVCADCEETHELRKYVLHLEKIIDRLQKENDNLRMYFDYSLS